MANHPKIKIKSKGEVIPYLWARLCINCGGIFDIRKSRFYENNGYNICSRHCYDNFTIIPTDTQKSIIEANNENKKTCRVCKKKFEIKYFNQEVCSPECSKKAEDKTISRQLRFEILKRDRFRCVYCGKNPIQHGIVLHVDHVFPARQLGDTEFTNLVTSCMECNFGKEISKIDEDLMNEIKERTNKNE